MLMMTEKGKKKEDKWRKKNNCIFYIYDDGYKNGEGEREEEEKREKK